MNETIGDRIAAALQNKNGGNQSELARAVGVTPQAVQQWVRGETTPRGRRLDKIAEFLGVTPQSLQFGDSSAAHVIAAPSRPDVIDVPVMNAAGSMGGGIMAPERDAVVGHMPLGREWIRRNLTISRPAALGILTAYGDSMSPTFNDGDVLLVDTGVTNLKLDAVYVLDRDGELFIKRVQRRLDGALVIRSDNPLYESFTMDADDLARLRVLGRVVWAWNGKGL